MFCVPIINNRGKSETFPHSFKKGTEKRNYWPICSEHRDISQNDNLIITRANFLKCQEFFFFLPVKGSTSEGKMVCSLCCTPI